MKSPVKIWSLAIAAVLLTLGLGGWALHLHARWSLARMKARLVAAGEKLSVEENLPAIVSESENGAREFLDAKGMLAGVDYNIQPTPMSFIAPGRARCLWVETNAATRETSDLWPDLREHLRTNRPALLKLRSALERPRLQFPVRYGAGFANLSFRHVASMKSTMQNLSASMLLELRDGQMDEAWLDLIAAVSIPVRWVDEPMLMSELVRAAIVAMASATTWEALQHPGWSEAQLAELQLRWESLPGNGAPVSAMSMERAMLGVEFELYRADPGRIRDLSVSFGVAASAGNVWDDLTEVGQKVVENPGDGLQLFMQLFPRRWAWGPWNSYYDEMWALDLAGGNLRAARDWERGVPFVEVQLQLQRAQRELGETPPQYLVSATGLAGVYDKFLEKQALAETQRRIVVTAIALRRHQLANGSWPATLDELVPRFLKAVPLDPMDGKPLRYRQVPGDAPLLYSVGTDGADAQGDPRPLTGNSKYWMMGRDMVWPRRASSEQMAEHYRDLESKRPADRKR